MTNIFTNQRRLVNEKTSAHSLRQALTDRALVILACQNICDGFLKNEIDSQFNFLFNTTKMENNRSDEVDLTSIFASIKKVFLNLFQWLGDLVRFALQNIKTLLVFIILGVGISIGLFFLVKPVYHSSLTMSHTRLNNGQCMDLINGLTKTSDKDTILVKKLGLDFKVAKQIKSILYKSINTDSDSLLNSSNFKIEVKVYNKKILDSLQMRILNFLEANEYASKRKQINRLYIDKIEEKLASEIVGVDSLKRIVNKSILPRSMGNGIILGESVDPVKVYQEGLNLFKSQLSLNEQRELNNSFEVVVGFSPAIRSTTLLKSVIMGFIISFVFGMVWIVRMKQMLGKGK